MALFILPFLDNKKEVLKIIQLITVTLCELF